jgi:hypothetical protein
MLFHRSINPVHCSALQLFNFRWIAGLNTAMGPAVAPKPMLEPTKNMLHCISDENKRGYFLRKALALCIGMLWICSIVAGSQD